MTKHAESSLQADNERVRVTRWDFAPGASTGRHRHEYDYVVVPLTDGALRIKSADGKEHVADLRAGVSYFRYAGVEHDVISINDFPFSFIEIEIR